MNVVDQLLAAAPTLVDARTGVTVDAAGLRRSVAAWRAHLDDLDVAPGDVVAVEVGDPLGFVAAHLAVLAAGATSVPLAGRHPAPERRRLLDAAEVGLVLDDDQAAGAAAHVVEGDPIIDVVQRADDDAAVGLLTSGTEGEPRPVSLTHGHLVYALAAVRTLGIELGPDDGFGLVVPADHVLGLTGILHLGLAVGARVVLALPADPGSLCAALVEHRVTVLAGPPTLWHDLTTHDGTDEAVRGLRIALSGAAPLDPQLAVRFCDRFDVVLHQAYGLTESTGIGATTLGSGPDADALTRSGSVGRPLPGVEVRLVDDAGVDVLVGDPGEIWLRGPSVAAASDDAGWLHTGDLGVVDATGALAVVDRLKDLIIVSGFNVHPAEVERVLRAAPGVAEAAVVSRPDDRTSERVEARVVAEAGVTLDVAELRAHCAAHLARYKVPTAFEIVERLPVTPLGKLRRHQLR